MATIATAPVWILAIVIFVLRVADVSLGTIRTVSIIKGKIGLSMVLGFFEVGIWITVIAQLISRLSESWILLVAYAGGFAAGNGAGILLERRLALGLVVARLVSQNKGAEVAETLRKAGHRITTFIGEGMAGPVTLLYAVGDRRTMYSILDIARMIDPKLFFVIESAHESNRGPVPRLRPVPHATGWRAVFKKK